MIGNNQVPFAVSRGCIIFDFFSGQWKGLIPHSVELIFPFSQWLTNKLDVLTLFIKTSFGHNINDIVCAITLENKHRGTWGVWRHLLAFLGWQHRAALQHFHVEKHYLAQESLLWVTLLPFKQWEVRTVTRLKTCFIRTGHSSTSWRGGKIGIPEKQLEMETGHLNGITAGVFTLALTS